MSDLSDQDLQVARELKQELQAAERHGKRTSWRKVTTVVDSFGGTRLTAGMRERIVDAFDEVGIVTEPDFREVQRGRTVRLRLKAPAVEVPAYSAPVSDVVQGVSASVWDRQGCRPGSLAQLGSISAATVLVQIAPSDLAEQSEVVRRLQRLSPAPSVADLEDLAEGDEFPRLSQDPDTGLVHFSTVAARAVDDIPETSSAAVDDLPETSTAAGALLIRPVEFLVGPDWLVTSWPTGVDETPAASTTDWGQDELLQSVVIDWTRLGTPTPWTLSLLITRRLAREYEQVVRSMGSWLENWEYAFVKGLADTDAKPDTQTLREVRGSVARLRQSLIALQSVVRGIEDRDLGDASLVADTRGSVDAALALLTELNDSVRGCMQLVSMKIAQGTQLAMEQTHSSSESTRRVFEYVAAFLAGPALIVGIFGANTWVPASGTVGGFVWMLLLSAITGILAFLTVSTVSRRRRAAQSRPAATDLPASDAHALEPRAAARTGSQFRTVTT